MTNYLSLWRQPQTLVFDLGNLVNEKYTGSFNATLTATFTDANLQGSQAPPADEVLAVSARRSDQGLGSAFTYPDEKAESLVTLPRNIRRAVVSIAANGQADEEFWWSNVPEAGVKTWANQTLPGLSSFREVRLWIDGNLAGLSWPFPVIFTGGISPPLHRPLVGPQAFDLREQEIDVTPWLGLLCNGKQHNFTIEVVGEGDAVVHRYWVLSAKVFLWLGKEGSVTTGSKPKVKVSALDFKPAVEVSPGSSLRYQQTINRELRITSYIKEGRDVTSKSWTQQFNMTNDGFLKSGGDFQRVEASVQRPGHGCRGGGPVQVLLLGVHVPHLDDVRVQVPGWDVQSDARRQTLAGRTTRHQRAHGLPQRGRALPIQAVRPAARHQRQVVSIRSRFLLPIQRRQQQRWVRQHAPGIRACSPRLQRD